jgi:hypothetical protein
MKITLERLLTSADGFDLPASPLQLAIARAADGRRIGSALDDEAIERHFGCGRSRIGLVTPVVVAIIAGVRSGKSLFAACAAVKSTCTADLDQLKKHEIPRFAIVAPTVDNANATFRLLVGHVQASPLLRGMMVGEPTADTLVLRRPTDGRIVEIVVVAAHRGAVTLRSRWLVGAVLDEVALFAAETEGATVNAEELLRAAEPRLVKGGQVWLISSPFGPSGLLWDIYRAHFGKPGRVLVVHAPTQSMNPAFPLEQIEELRATKPDVAAREFDAEWLEPDTAMYPHAQLDAARRSAPLEEAPIAGAAYYAGQDPASRANAYTLVIARAEVEKGETKRVVVAFCRQWVGSKKRPLDLDAVMNEIAGICGRYRVRKVASDGYSADALKAIGRHYGLTIDDQQSTTAETYERFESARVLLAQDRIELPPDAVFLADLKAVRKKALANQIRIDLPRTSNGRHCDYAPAFALAVAGAPRATKRQGDPDRARRTIEFNRNAPTNGADTAYIGDRSWDASHQAHYRGEYDVATRTFRR